MMDKLRSWLPTIHSNTRGDIPVSTLLIVGVVVLPLIFFLIGFKDDLANFVNARVGEATANDAVNQFGNGFSQ